MFTICALWPWLWREMTLVIMVWSIIWIQACDLEAMVKTLNKTTCTVTLTLDYDLGLKTKLTLGLWTPCMYGVIPIQCSMNNRPNSYGQYPCLSPRNSVGGDIVMRPFVCGWVSEWVREWVRPSVALHLVDKIATKVFVQSLSNFTCKLWIMRGGTLLILGHGVKGQGQLWHSVYKTLWTRYRLTVFAQSLSNFTCKLRMMREGTLLIFGSQGQRSRSALALCV